MRVRRPFSLFRRERRASVSIMAVGSLGVCMACAALTIDLGLLINKRTTLQAASDAAALASVSDSVSPQSTATQVLGQYGFSPSSLQSLITGTYCPDSAIAPANRFTAGIVAGCAVPTGPLPNAVRLASAASANMSFATLFNGQRSITTHSGSTAARIDVAGLEAGTGTVQLNGGLLDATLSSVLGQDVSLDLVAYNGLLNTNIKALDFLNALAAQLHATGTYGTLLNANVSLQSVLNAEVTALRTAGGGTALNAAVGLQALVVQLGAGLTVNLSRLIDPGIWQNDTIGSLPASAIQPSLNAADLLNAAVQLSSNGSTIPGTGITLPGIGSLTVAASAIEPPQSSYFGFGPTETTVHTAQVRLLIKLTLLGAIGGSSSLVTLPIYVEVGSGTASISGISCGANPAVDAKVMVQANSSVANAYIGNIPLNVMQNFNQSLAGSLTSAALVNLPGILTISGRASATVGSSAPQTLTFTQANIQTGQNQTVASTQLIGSLVQSLLGNLSLQATVLGGLGINLTGSATAQLQSLLTAVPLDQVIDPLLQMLGVQVGYMTVAATGVRCGVPVLVQ